MQRVTISDDRDYPEQYQRPRWLLSVVGDTPVDWGAGKMGG